MDSSHAFLTKYIETLDSSLRVFHKVINDYANDSKFVNPAMIITDSHCLLQNKIQYDILTQSIHYVSENESNNIFQIIAEMGELGALAVLRKAKEDGINALLRINVLIKGEYNLISTNLMRRAINHEYDEGIRHLVKEIDKHLKTR